MRPRRGRPCASPSATPRRRRTSTRWSQPSGPPSSGPGGRPELHPGGPEPTADRSARFRGAVMRVLAAMSGGVDSAVAAARWPTAGHDVTGVHLALSRNPQSFRTGARGCCTLEDSRDARRAADVIGIPFYVWDMAARFHEDVVEDFVAEYAAGRTPNPCLRCNEKIKFAAVLDRALALGFDAVAHRPLRQGRPPRNGRRAAPGGRRGQGPVLRPRRADRGSAGARDLPARSVHQGSRYEPRRLTAAWGVADKPDSHDICFIADGDTARLPATQARGAPGRIVDETGDVLREHDGSYAFTVGQRRGSAARRTGRGRRAALRPRHRTRPGHGDRRAAIIARRRPSRGRQATVV